MTHNSKAILCFGIVLGLLLGICINFIFPPKIEPIEYVFPAYNGATSSVLGEISIISEKKKCDDADGLFRIQGGELLKGTWHGESAYIPGTYYITCTLKTPDRKLFNYKME